MGIPFKHLKGLMTGDGGHLHRVQALLEKPACGFMPEIVKGEIDQKEGLRVFSLFLKRLFVGFPGAGNSTDKSMSDRIRLHPPHIPVDSSGNASKDPDRFGG